MGWRARGSVAITIALVAETLGDAREVVIDGISGICRIAQRSRPEFEISRRRLVWPNGAMAQVFSSEDPESLRGRQFHLAWCDELDDPQGGHLGNHAVARPNRNGSDDRPHHGTLRHQLRIAC